MNSATEHVDASEALDCRVQSVRRSKNSIELIGESTGLQKNIKISIPKNLKDDPLCNTLIDYVAEVVAVNIEKSKLGFVYLLIRFFSYLEEYFGTSSTLPNSIFQEYKGHLVNQSNIDPNSARSYLGMFRTSITWAIEDQKHYSTLSTKAKRQLISTLAKIPSIAYSPSQPRKGLSGILENTDYDDHTLLDSANRFCSIYLKILNEHRVELLKDPGILSVVDEAVKLGNLNRCDWKRTAIDHDFFLPIYYAILDSTSLTLKERLLSSDKIYRMVATSLNRPLNLSIMNQLLKSSMTNDGRLKRNKPKFKETANIHVTFESLDYRFLLQPGVQEEVCLGWLLAADRVQESGLLQMSLEDIGITRSHAAVRFKKNRSSKKDRSATAHRENTRQYKILKIFHSLRTDFNNNFPQHASAHVFNSKSTFECLININSLPYRLVCLAVMPNSAMKREILDRDPKALPFMELLAKVNYSNLAHREEILEYQHYINTSEDGKTTEGRWEECIASPRINIPLGAFAQSRAIISDDKFNPESAYDRHSKSIVDADNTAHTQRTKLETYKSRSDTSYRSNKRSAFARDVGLLMEMDARKVASQISRTEVFSYQKIKLELGWSTQLEKIDDIEGFNALVEKAESRGYTLTPFGALNHGEKRFFIDSPITVALMLSYQTECARVINESVNLELTLSLNIKSSYISEVITRMSSASQLQGKELYQSAQFPTPQIY